MSSCFCFFQGSKTWKLGLLASIFAIFASFSSGVGFLFFVSVLLICATIPFFFASSKQKPPLKASHESEKDHFLRNQGKNLKSSAEYPHEKVEEIVVSEMDRTGHKKEFKENGRQDFLYSESEGTDQNSSTSSEDHASDIEYWPQRMDCWDDSISDEESLIEIDIPNGQFVYPGHQRHPKNFMNLNCCSKLSTDFLTDGNIHEINEEDNLIEIDIYMGSIKCSSFEI